MVDERTTTLSDRLKNDGYVKISNLFDKNDSILLKEKVQKLIQNHDKTTWKSAEEMDFEYRVPTVETNDWAILTNFLGLDKSIDNIIEKFFSNTKLKDILESCIGTDYKLWSGSIRLAKSRDNGLGFHTDSPGEMGISVLLTDQNDSDGTTSFIKGSHKWPLSSKESGISSIPRRFFQPISVPAKGKIGDVYVFFKKTYHGRLPHQNNKQGLCLLFAPIASGYKFPRYKIKSSTLDLLGPELNNLLNDKNIIKIPKKDNNKVNNEYMVIKNNDERYFIDELYAIKVNLISFWQLFKLFRVIAYIARLFR